MGRARAFRGMVASLTCASVLAGCPAHHNSGEAKPTASSPAAGPALPAVVGRGPFVVYDMLNDAGDARAIVMDLTTNKRVELPSGWRGAEIGSGYTIAAQVWGNAVPILMEDSESTSLTLLGRRAATGAKVYGRLLQFSASPDGSSIVALAKRHEADHHLELFLITGPAARLIALPRASIPWIDGDFSMAPTVWLPHTGWLSRGYCACDYGSSTQGWFQMTSRGNLTPERRLGFPGPSLSASHDGRLVAWLSVPEKPCGRFDDVCPDGPIKIVIADTVRRSVREIGNYRNGIPTDTSIGISPDGSRLAFSDRRGVRLIDPRDGSVVGATRYPNSDLQVLALMDDRSVLVQRNDTTSSGYKTTLLLFHFRINWRADVREIVSGNLNFSGWIK